MKKKQEYLLELIEEVSLFNSISSIFTTDMLKFPTIKKESDIPILTTRDIKIFASAAPYILILTTLANFSYNFYYYGDLSDLKNSIPKVLAFSEFGKFSENMSEYLNRIDVNFLNQSFTTLITNIQNSFTSVNLSSIFNSFLTFINGISQGKIPNSVIYATILIPVYVFIHKWFAGYGNFIYNIQTNYKNLVINLITNETLRDEDIKFLIDYEQRCNDLDFKEIVPRYMKWRLTIRKELLVERNKDSIMIKTIDSSIKIIDDFIELQDFITTYKFPLEMELSKRYKLPKVFEQIVILKRIKEEKNSENFIGAAIENTIIKYLETSFTKVKYITEKHTIEEWWKLVKQKPIPKNTFYAKYLLYLKKNMQEYAFDVYQLELR